MSEEPDSTSDLSPDNEGMRFDIKEYFLVKPGGHEEFLGQSDDGSGIDRRAKGMADKYGFPVRVYLRKGHEYDYTIYPTEGTEHSGYLKMREEGFKR